MAETTPTQPKLIRCGIYTRKSTSEGLDQDFTSLDAQREAAESYIASQTQYVLIIPDGQRITLHPARGLRTFVESRTKVRIHGFRIEDDLLFDGASSLSQPSIAGSGIDVLEQPGNPPVLGDQRTLVILINFQDDLRQPLTPAQAAERMFTGSASVNARYAEISYNNVSFSGNVIGWYTLPITRTCDLNAQLNATIPVVDPDVDFRLYSRLVLINPYCGAAGTVGKLTLSTQEGLVEASVTWMHGDYVLTTNALEQELGHNFGLRHANSLDCGVATLGESCASTEYGDLFDVMGQSSQPSHFNAVHKELVGWFDPTNILSATTTGTYTLEPLESIGSGLKTLKLQRGPTEYLYVEFRQPLGLDQWMNNPAYNVIQGALLHTNSFLANGDTQLLDATPASRDPVTDFFDAALAPGQILEDPASGSTVRVVSVSESTLTIDVTIGQTDFTPPSVEITSPSHFSTVSGSIVVQASASDTSGIDRVEFYRSNWCGGGDVLFATDTAAPYQGLLDTTRLPNGLNRVYA
jgi:hypothetical protein